MEVIEGGSGRAPLAASLLALGALSLLALTVLAGGSLLELTPLLAVLVVAITAYRLLYHWVTPIAGVILVVLFVPIRIYKLPGSLPFDLEPYRLLVALVFIGWGTSLLIDRRVRLRRTMFDTPLAIIVAAAFASVLANPTQVNALGSYVVKSLTFFLSFVLLFYLIVSVIRSERQVAILTRVLVLGGTIVAAAAILERRTGYNVFHHLQGVIPGLRLEGDPGEEVRAGRLRVMGSAQHPIALGAVFVMLVPLAIYLMKSCSRRSWWALAAGVLFLGTLATSSRTSIIMLAVVGLVFLALRPVETRRLWPVLVPAIVVVHFVLPGALGTVRGAFFPQGGLVAEQSNVQGDQELANGRLADIGPSLDEWSRRPVLGEGLGTRITGFTESFVNARILDDQWLGTLLETGIVGVAGWLFLLVRSVRRLGREAKADRSPRGWLMASLAASIAAFGVGMLTFDAFSFIQVTFLFWILLAFGAALLPSGARLRESRRLQLQNQRRTGDEVALHEVEDGSSDILRRADAPEERFALGLLLAWLEPERPRRPRAGSSRAPHGSDEEGS
jgi:O-antigen ligase